MKRGVFIFDGSLQWGWGVLQILNVNVYRVASPPGGGGYNKSPPITAQYSCCHGFQFNEVFWMTKMFQRRDVNTNPGNDQQPFTIYNKIIFSFPIKWTYLNIYLLIIYFFILSLPDMFVTLGERSKQHMFSKMRLIMDFLISWTWTRMKIWY